MRRREFTRNRILAGEARDFGGPHMGIEAT